MQLTQQALKSTNAWFQFQPHPFRLLLYLEWLLVFTVLLLVGGFGLGRSDLFGRLALSTAEIPELIAVLVLFVLLGLRLPTGQGAAKWLYTGLQLALLGWATYLLDWGLDYIAPLLIVVVLRSCFLFDQRGRWIIAGLTTLRLASDFQRSTGLQPLCQTAVQIALAPLPQRIQVAVYRIVEEALTGAAGF